MAIKSRAIDGSIRFISNMPGYGVCSDARYSLRAKSRQLLPLLIEKKNDEFQICELSYSRLLFVLFRFRGWLSRLRQGSHRDDRCTISSAKNHSRYNNREEITQMVGNVIFSPNLLVWLFTICRTPQSVDLNMPKNKFYFQDTIQDL